MGLVNRFAASAGGAGPTVIIAPVLATDNTGVIAVSDFGGCARTTAVTTTLILQGSNDGFVLNIVPLDQVEIPTTGTIIKTLESPILIPIGRAFRVIATQVTPGPFSITVLGETSNSLVNILDLT